MGFLKAVLCEYKDIMMTFEDLENWRQARQLVRNIYSLTGERRLARDFALCSQLQRAGVSIMSNIAEGFERGHISEKCQFYNIARASTGEVRSLLYEVEDNYVGSASAAEKLRLDVESVGRLISRLVRSTEKRRPQR
jgi:four helix bundle protein